MTFIMDFFSVTKSEWRQLLKERRRGLSKQRYREASEDAYKTLLSLCEQHRYVLSYASFGSELDMWKLNEQLMKSNQLILPRLLGDILELYQVQSYEQLEKHAWGMLQPNPDYCLSIPPEEIDLILVPGLGFDSETGARLGYGKGHYDRLLSSLTTTKKWGVGFKEQHVSSLAHELHDVPMHQVHLF